MSLPVKEVALAMANSTTSEDNNKKIVDYNRSKSMADIDSKSANKNKVMYTDIHENPSLPVLQPKIKIPHTTNVNEAKLKIILNELKRIEKNKLKIEEDVGTHNSNT